MPDKPDEVRTDRASGVFTGYGIGSAVLGLVSVAAIVLGFMVWSGHRHQRDELAYQTSALQAAADWTNVLINMSADTVDTSLRTLHDGTVGQLNADFETTVEPFKQLVLKLKSKTVGQVDSVSIESLHHPQAGQPGAPKPQPELETVVSRTDTVLVVATSRSQNAGGDQPQPVRWNLRLGVSDVDGKLLISRLETIR
ncbi:hypothetical protein CIW52_00045 [Mycolicibacterium sp. P9-64]|uniref:hypothetical protein n=1 Tax=Mycolicibacterium sp. P9-64 TaxID=2024612 RepID=UPI0011F005CF|nr:hypothetical protein [Mycolicibacterium sp. P9-64]KAA0086390.1 hypothetical protein CIW52_00045 [Mycolicibacterium sp. P9-64]